VTPSRTSLAVGVLTCGLLLASVVGLQAVREAAAPPQVAASLLYVRSPEFMKRAVLSYDALAADLYWIRAVQHYGRTKLAPGTRKDYELLFPLLDLTTSLDPNFNLAYRFGGIFLAEPAPGGAGRPDQAIALLEKGLKVQPNHWEFAQDIGFVYYWWVRDYERAASWFTRAAAMPGAPKWMPSLAAVTLAEGGNRAMSRRLWEEMLRGEELEWLRSQAQFRLRQLDAMDQIDTLERVVALYAQRGTLPRGWIDLGRAGLLQRVPVDPDGFAYQLNPVTGDVTVDPSSTINPLPARGRSGR
jgi:tetratricopeptide (TPR) repeat protein